MGDNKIMALSFEQDLSKYVGLSSGKHTLTIKANPMEMGNPVTDLIRGTLQSMLLAEGATKPCAPELRLSKERQAEYEFFGKPMDSKNYKNLKTTAQCFKCIKSFVGDFTSGASMEMVCGRPLLEGGTPKTFPDRVGPLSFPYYLTKWRKGDGCGFTNCPQFGMMDRVASRVFNNNRVGAYPFGFDEVIDLPEGGTIWVCAESTWTVPGPADLLPFNLATKGAVYDGGQFYNGPVSGEKVKKDAKPSCKSYRETLSGTCKYSKLGKTAEEGTTGYSETSQGTHYGGVLCIVAGFGVQCIQFMMGAGVLATNDRICGAWDGGYMKTAPGGDDWDYLAMKYHIQARLATSGSADYKPCTSYEKEESVEDERLFKP